MREPGHLQPYLGYLERLPFVRGLHLELEDHLPVGLRADAILQIQLPKGNAVEIAIEVKRTNLTYALAQALRARAEQAKPYPLLVAAPKITRGVGQALAEHGINYVDAAGNCWINLQDQYFAVIEGRQPKARTPRGRGLGAPGYQVLFALLALPNAEKVTLRDLARQAGTAPGTATTTLQRLEAEGLVLRARRRLTILERQGITEKWIHGYQDQVRPKWLKGRYRTADQTPETLETRVSEVLGRQHPGLHWAWGGGAGVMRLTGYFHGPENVLYVKQPPHDLPNTLRALPDDNGPLVIIEVPTKLFLEGPKANVVHPLLVYAELLGAHDERAQEAAEEIRLRYLE